MDFTELERDFIHILTHGKKNNTYKFAFARFLLDFAKSMELKKLEELEKQNKLVDVTYAEIAKYFLEYYWHQEFHSKIRQNYHVDSKPLVIKIMREEFTQGEYIGNLFKKIKEKEPEAIAKSEKRIAEKCFDEVVPRFQKMVDGNKTKLEQTFYVFSKKESKISIKPNALLFFKQHHTILLKSVILEWAKFLEKINKNTTKLISKIESEDNPRTSLKKYEKVLLSFFEDCFYCNRVLEDKKIHVDHFIPRVYIREDDIWNFVLACSECNCAKSGSLAPKKFLDALIQRNGQFRTKIKGLERSLQILDLGKGFEKEIKAHYDNAKEQKYKILGENEFQR